VQNLRLLTMHTHTYW